MNRARSAFKVKQYLSCHVPVLANPVCECGQFVIDGVNGFLCRDKDEFEERIHFFYNLAPDKFEKFIKGCQVNVASFSLDQYCQRFLEILLGGRS